MLPFILEPHGSNFLDVVAVLQPLISSLEKCKPFKIDNGQELFVCAFTLFFTEDMSQQQANSECLFQ